MSVEKHREKLDAALDAVVNEAAWEGVLRDKDAALALAECALKCLGGAIERPLAIQEAMSALNAAVGFLSEE